MNEKHEEGLRSILGSWPKPLLVKRLREWADSLDRVENTSQTDPEALTRWATRLRAEADKLDGQG